MPAQTEREARLAQKLRANLARRKQQVRGRQTGAGSNAVPDNGRDQDACREDSAAASGAMPPGLDRDDPPA